MTIRYHRVGYRIERLPDPDTLSDLSDVALEQQVAAAIAFAEETSAIVQAFATNLRRDMQRHRRLWEGRHGGGLHEAPWITAARLGAQGHRPARTGPRGWHGSSTEAVLLQSAREVAGMSQRQLAEELHCSRALLAEVERGRRAMSPVVAGWVRETLAGRQ